MRMLLPKSSRQWAQFHFQISQLIKSGTLPAEAFADMASHGATDVIRKLSKEISVKLQSGRTLAESLSSMPAAVPSLDRALLTAGEKSGRLEEIFYKLGEYYSQIAELKSKAISLLIYPVGLLHFGLLIFPMSHITNAITGAGAGSFLRAKIITFSIFWGILSLPYFIFSPEASPETKEWLNSVLNRLPFIGPARKTAGLARFCLALEALTSAGLTPLESWPLSAQASDNIDIQKFVSQMKSRMKDGSEISILLRPSEAFPPEFISQFRVGEKTGQQEQTLKRLAVDYAKQSEVGLKNLSVWLPRLVYIFVVLFSAYNIFTELKSAADKITFEN